jgi:RND superfamily putative drug exporter
LVAVGADYNMLLISRIRDESPHGVRIGVIRTVGSTGGVITSAGLIFAASMFGLMAASINTMAQAGFTIGIGIVLDTFLVRTVTVPALTALIGRANWWPSELGRDPSKPRRKRRRATKFDLLLERVKGIRLSRPQPSVAAPRKAPVARPTNGHAGRTRPAGKPRTLRNGKPLSQNKGNSKYLVDQLPGHSLPLFGLTGMPSYDVLECVSKANEKSKDIGTEQVDHLLGHSLPLFGLAGLPTYDLLDGSSDDEGEHHAGGSKPDRNKTVIT